MGINAVAYLVSIGPLTKDSQLNSGHYSGLRLWGECNIFVPLFRFFFSFSLAEVNNYHLDSVINGSTASAIPFLLAQNIFQALSLIQFLLL